MRSLHLPSSHFPDTLGGTEVYVQQLADALRARHHPADVAWHTASRVVPPHHALPPVPVDLLGSYRREQTEPPPGFEALLDRTAPDLVHFHAFTAGAGLGHARLLRARGVPYLVTFHTPSMACARGTWLFEGRTPCDGGLDDVGRCARCTLQGRGVPAPVATTLARSPLRADRLLAGPWTSFVAAPALLAEARRAWHAFFHGAQRVIACAEFVRERLVRNGVAAERIVVLRQALPGATRSRTLRIPRVLITRPLRIGFFGRVTHVKGPDLLVSATRRLRADGLDVEAEIVGPVAPGEQRWFDAALASAEGRVRHRGALRGDALAGWLAQIDLVAIPSRWFETGPLTLLEAWDAGALVIGSDRGGIAEFVRPAGQERLLFAPDDPEALAGAVRRALEARHYATEVTVPGMDALTEAHLALYADVLAGRG